MKTSVKNRCTVAEILRLFFPLSTSFCRHNYTFGYWCVDADNRLKVKRACGLTSKGSLDESHNYSNERDSDMHSTALGGHNSAAIVLHF